MMWKYKLLGKYPEYVPPEKQNKNIKKLGLDNSNLNISDIKK